MHLFKSIRAQLTLAFISLAVTPILVVGLILSYKSFSALKEGAIAHQRVEAERVALAVEGYVRDLERVLELTSRAHSFMSLERIEQQKILEELLAYENRFQELTLVNNNGKELIRCNRIQVVFGKSLDDRSGDPVFQQAMAFSLRVGDIAEGAGHHPAILTEWGKVTVTWWSHSIKGLHKNDLIMAARTDEVVKG